MAKNVNTIVVGAGRLGSSIARLLVKQNNNVLLIDKDKSQFDHVLDYSGFSEVGDATDLEVLKENGINKAQRIIVVTDDDNTNIYISDLCLNKTNVKEVYIRLTDSRKTKITDKRVKCICPFDLSIDDFTSQMGGEF